MDHGPDQFRWWAIYRSSTHGRGRPEGLLRRRSDLPGSDEIYNPKRGCWTCSNLLSYLQEGTPHGIEADLRQIGAAEAAGILRVCYGQEHAGRLTAAGVPLLAMTRAVYQQAARCVGFADLDELLRAPIPAWEIGKILGVSQGRVSELRRELNASQARTNRAPCKGEGCERLAAETGYCRGCQRKGQQREAHELTATAAGWQSLDDLLADQNIGNEKLAQILGVHRSQARQIRHAAGCDVGGSTPNLRAPLPDAYAKALLRLYRSGQHARLNASLVKARQARWTLRALGDALGITGEAVRLRCDNADKPPHPNPLKPPPAPPRGREPAASQAPPEPILSQEDMRQLRELHRQSVKLRGRMPMDAPERKAAKSLAAVLAGHRIRRISYLQLGQAMGVKPGTVRALLKRYGYLAPPQPQVEPVAGALFIKDAAARTGVTTSTVWSHVYHGTLPRPFFWGQRAWWPPEVIERGQFVRRRAWTQHEEAQLRELAEHGWSASRIGAQLGRSPGAVGNRLWLLGRQQEVSHQPEQKGTQTDA